MMPVMIPPMRKLIWRGARLAKSFAGETTLAAMLVASVAIASAISARTESDRAVEALHQLHRIPDRLPENDRRRARDRDADERVEGHRERQPERLARRSGRAAISRKREKSGMLSESVAQKPTIAVRPAAKTGRNSAVDWNFEGWAKIGPQPLAATNAQTSRPDAGEDEERRGENLEPLDRFHSPNEPRTPNATSIRSTTP